MFVEISLTKRSFFVGQEELKANPIPSHLSLYYQHIGGMKNRLKNFYLSTHSCNFNVFAITETWLNESIKDNEIASNDYIIFRKDRTPKNSCFSKGGGVIIGVLASINPQHIETPDDIELVCVSFTFQGNTFFVSNSYIPPLSSKETYNKHAAFISETIHSFTEDVICIVLGDFNLPHLNWIMDEENEDILLPLNSSQKDEEFLDVMATSCLYQLNFYRNINEHILDLIYCNELDSSTVYPVSEIDLLHPNTSVHHKAMCFEYFIPQLNQFEDIDFPAFENDFKNGKLDELDNRIGNFDWISIFEGKTMEESTTSFYSNIYEMISQTIPKRRKIFTKTPIWFNKEIKTLKNKMNKLHKKLRSSNCMSTRNKYYETKNALDSKIKDAYRMHLVKVQLSFQKDPTKFWDYISEKSKTKDFPKSMTYKGNRSDKKEVKCEYFKDFFQTEYCKESADFEENINMKRKINGVMSIPKFRMSDIQKELLLLDDSKSSGPDDISSFLLKRCAGSISIPLTILFNKSLESGCVPKIWKKSFIVPLHKSKAKDNVEHYRGIAKLPVIPKLFEKMICDCTVYHWNSIICDAQHGFMKKRSTATNLLNFTSSTVRNFSQGCQTDCIYTDFSKAFDKVNHKLLIMKLDKKGFSPWFTNWVSSYLSERVQLVKFENITSTNITVTSGVPQGSHLGPLLFLVFIDDLFDVIEYSNMLMYADDCKIYKKIADHNDTLKLQQDLNSVCNWCYENDMKLNIGKCQIMSFYRKKNPVIHDYYLNATQLGRVTQFKDLGVLFDRKLSFSLHLDYLISSSNMKLGMIFRFGKEFNSLLIYKTLYSSLVRQNLEYCSVVWNPQYLTHIRRLESIQKQFVLRVLRHLPWGNPLHLPPYHERCNLLRLVSLQKRREIISIIFVCKILKGDILAPYVLKLFCFKVPNYNLRNFKLLTTNERIRQNYLKFEPINVMVNLFNENDSNIDFNLSYDCIKNKISKL